MRSLRERILLRRAQDYVKRYTPLLIGIAGGPQRHVAAAALQEILKDIRRVRVGSVHTPYDVALAILGLEAAQKRGSWIRLLTGSRIRELVEEEPDTFIIEMTAEKARDIDAISQAFPFAFGLVTDVPTAHLTFFETPEMAAHELQSLITMVPRSGHVILSADDPLARAMVHSIGAPVTWVGADSQAAVRLRRAHPLPQAGWMAEIIIAGRSYELTLPHVMSRFHLAPLLAALAVATQLRIDPARAIKRLHNFMPPPGHIRLLPGRQGSRVLDVSDDASVEEMSAGLEALQQLSGRRKIAVLGDVTQLGRLSQGQHRRIGEQAAAIARVLVVVGEAMQAAGAVAIKAGADVHHFSDSREVGKWLGPYVRSGDIILVSGSRDMHMENVIRRLVAQPGA